MRIINDFDLITPIGASATDVFSDLGPILALLAGALLAMWVIEFLIDLFHQEDSIVVAGRRLTGSSINSSMDMEWYRSLSYEDQKRIATFDHEQARKKYKNMTR